MPIIKWTPHSSIINKSSHFLLGGLLHLLVCLGEAPPVVDEPPMYGKQHPQFQQQQQMAQIQCYPDWQWRCSDGMQCIALYDLCDGIAQCADHSDERNCDRSRFPNTYHEGYRVAHPPAPVDPQHPPLPPHQAPPPPPHTEKTPIKAAAPADLQHSPPMRAILSVLTVFVLVAGLIHMLMKRRRRQQMGASVRGFRKGESLVEDEDDLLISQIYG